MVIKKYLVKDMKEALVRIKRELGPDAFIISTYKVPGRGFWGLFTRYLEVTAALDQWSGERAPGLLNGVKREALPSGGFVPQTQNITKKDLIRSVLKFSLDLPGKKQPGQRGVLSLAPAIGPLVVSRPLLTSWEKKLQDLDLNEELVRQVLSDARFGQGSRGEEAVFRLWVESRLAAIWERYCAVSAGKRAVVLLGPSGVGKTTVLLKLATRLALYENKKIGIIALHQGSLSTLNHYSQMMGAQVARVSDIPSMNSALEAFGEKDCIFVDTPSEPFVKDGKLLELASLLGQMEGAQAFLVLSATNRDSDIIRAVQKTVPFACAGLIFTKLDEAASVGSVLSLLPRLGLPLCYISCGQEIPDDLYPAGGEILTHFLLGGIGCDQYRVREFTQCSTS